MPLKLTEYLPDPSTLDAQAILATRRRLQAYLEEFWPQLDTRPNSVFGDLYLTPADATMMTALEVAGARFKSDLDPVNVSRGVIYDPEFVEAFLRNFGVDRNLAVNASGTIRMVFSEDAEYVFPSSVTFTFGSSVFFVNPDEAEPLIIRPTSDVEARRHLTRTDDDRYEIYLPVMGNPGAVISDGDQAVFSEELESLVSVSAVGDMDPGQPAEDVIALANKARRQFAAHGLSSRSGVISFASYRWPGMVALSATVTGDREMLRGGYNVLGVSEGAVDLFVRSSASLVKGECILPLTYDLQKQAWVGQLALPATPAFPDLLAGVFQVNNQRNMRGVNRIYARSEHPAVDSVAVSYSRFERLGIEVVDTAPQDFLPGYVGNVAARTPTSLRMEVREEDNGSRFGRHGRRAINMRLDGLVTLADDVPAIRANVRDSVSGELAVVYFVADDSSNPTRGMLVQNGAGYDDMFSGLELDLVPVGSSFNMAEAVGLEYTLDFAGRTANFSVNYLYDPFLEQVDSVLNNADHKPVNVDPVVRGFIICHIDQFTINYRVRYGQRLDTEAAAEEIVTYLNQLGYPRQYADSQIGTIIQKYGADGLQSVVKRGYFHPSIATTQVLRDGSEVSLPRIETRTLIPASNDYGFGPRNVGYLIERDTLTFHGVAH